MKSLEMELRHQEAAAQLPPSTRAQERGGCLLQEGLHLISSVTAQCSEAQTTGGIAKGPAGNGRLAPAYLQVLSGGGFPLFCPRAPIQRARSLLSGEEQCQNRPYPRHSQGGVQASSQFLSGLCMWVSCLITQELGGDGWRVTISKSTLNHLTPHEKLCFIF